MSSKSWYFKSWFIWLLLIVISFCVYKSCSVAKRAIRRAKGFSIEKIIIRQEPEKVIELGREKIDAANKICDQPFFFLSKGKQFFVFISADGKYVIKFFQQQRFEVKDYATWVPDFIANFLRNQQRAEKLERLHKMVQSSELAYEKAPEQTGIFFIHMNKTRHQHKKLTVLDCKGNLFYVPLDDVQFLLQRRAALLKQTLVTLMYEGREDEAKARLKQIFDLLVYCAKAGIYDTDGALIRNDNIGFLDTRAMYIDMGKFIPTTEAFSPAMVEWNFRRLHPLHNWLKKNYPALAAYFEECRQAALGEIS
jgi:hypothetical protein